MKLLKLRRGGTVKVDNEDYDKIIHINWYKVVLNKSTYVMAVINTGPKQRQSILLHHYILGITNRENRPKTRFIDGDGLNCQKNNLIEWRPIKNPHKKKVK